MIRKAKLILPLLLASSVGIANAATESSDVRAEIVARAITLVNDVGMDFGQILPFSVPGTVRVRAVGSLTVNNAQVVDTTTVTPSRWTVTGISGGRFSIDLPADNTIELNNGNGSSMQLTTFEHNAGATPTLGPNGDTTFAVGAALQIGPNQAPGIYQGEFNVTVNYL
ncbi:MAG: DUF4402 domain-containing protein [Xanthomonadales bacterium]|jgi:hypothetical protein|nr:DUF4402 domain-containing protein [Xanthomonadales bacterium]